MRYYKNAADGYVLGIGIGPGGEEITEEEYGRILALIQSKPPRDGLTDYRMREDFTWEAYEAEPDPEDIDESEVFDIIFGGAT